MSLRVWVALSCLLSVLAQVMFESSGVVTKMSPYEKMAADKTGIKVQVVLNETNQTSIELPLTSPSRLHFAWSVVGSHNDTFHFIINGQVVRSISGNTSEEVTYDCTGAPLTPCRAEFLPVNNEPVDDDPDFGLSSLKYYRTDTPTNQVVLKIEDGMGPESKSSPDAMIGTTFSIGVDVNNIAAEVQKAGECCGCNSCLQYYNANQGLCKSQGLHYKAGPACPNENTCGACMDGEELDKTTGRVVMKAINDTATNGTVSVAVRLPLEIRAQIQLQTLSNLKMKQDSGVEVHLETDNYVYRLEEQKHMDKGAVLNTKNTGGDLKFAFTNSEMTALPPGTFNATVKIKGLKAALKCHALNPIYVSVNDGMWTEIPPPNVSGCQAPPTLAIAKDEFDVMYNESDLKCTPMPMLQVNDTTSDPPHLTVTIKPEHGYVCQGDKTMKVFTATNTIAKLNTMLVGLSYKPYRNPDGSLHTEDPIHISVTDNDRRGPGPEGMAQIVVKAHIKNVELAFPGKHDAPSKDILPLRRGIFLDGVPSYPVQSPFEMSHKDMPLAEFESAFGNTTNLTMTVMAKHGNVSINGSTNTSLYSRTHTVTASPMKILQYLDNLSYKKADAKKNEDGKCIQTIAMDELVIHLGVHFPVIEMNASNVTGNGTNVTGNGTNMNGNGTNMTGNGTNMTGNGTNMTGNMSDPVPTMRMLTIPLVIPADPNDDACGFVSSKYIDYTPHTAKAGDNTYFKFTGLKVAGFKSAITIAISSSTECSETDHFLSIASWEPSHKSALIAVPELPGSYTMCYIDSRDGLAWDVMGCMGNNTCMAQQTPWTSLERTLEVTATDPHTVFSGFSSCSQFLASTEAKNLDACGCYLRHNKTSMGMGSSMGSKPDLQFLLPREIPLEYLTGSDEDVEIGCCYKASKMMRSDAINITDTTTWGYCTNMPIPPKMMNGTNTTNGTNGTNGTNMTP